MLSNARGGGRRTGGVQQCCDPCRAACGSARGLGQRRSWLPLNRLRGHSHQQLSLRREVLPQGLGRCLHLRAGSRCLLHLDHRGLGRDLRRHLCAGLSSGAHSYMPQSSVVHVAKQVFIIMFPVYSIAPSRSLYHLSLSLSRVSLSLARFSL